MTLPSNLDPGFVSRLTRLAAFVDKSPEDVYAIWREYSNACRDYDQSAIWSEFCAWYADRLSPISQARAQEIWAQRGPQNDIDHALTGAEREFLKRLWDRIPSGSSCLMSAFYECLNGRLANYFADLPCAV